VSVIVPVTRSRTARGSCAGRVSRRRRTRYALAAPGAAARGVRTWRPRLDHRDTRRPHGHTLGLSARPPIYRLRVVAKAAAKETSVREGGTFRLAPAPRSKPTGRTLGSSPSLFPRPETWALWRRLAIRGQRRHGRALFDSPRGLVAARLRGCPRRSPAPAARDWHLCSHTSPCHDP
jgi:hypothetical protein